MLYPLSYGGSAARIVAEAFARLARVQALLSRTQALLMMRPLAPR